MDGQIAMRQSASTTSELIPRRLAYRVFGICLSLELLVVFLDCYFNWGLGTRLSPIKHFFDITLEDGLPAWFAETQTLLVGLTAWVIWGFIRRAGASRWRRAGWIFLAAFFTYMAADDGTRLHERIGSAYQQIKQPAVAAAAVNDEEQVRAPAAIQGFPSYAWQLLFVPAFGLAGLLILVFLWRELRDTGAFLGVITALSCWVVAVGLDFFEGLDQSHPWNVYVWIINRFDLIDFTARHFDSLPFDTVRHFSMSLEEFLEMLGMTMFWTVFLRHLAALSAGSVLQIRDHPPANKN